MKNKRSMCTKKKRWIKLSLQDSIHMHPSTIQNLPPKNPNPNPNLDFPIPQSSVHSPHPLPSGSLPNARPNLRLGPPLYLDGHFIKHIESLAYPSLKTNFNFPLLGRMFSLLGLAQNGILVHDQVASSGFFKRVCSFRTRWFTYILASWAALEICSRAVRWNAGETFGESELKMRMNGSMDQSFTSLCLSLDRDLDNACQVQGRRRMRSNGRITNVVTWMDDHGMLLNISSIWRVARRWDRIVCIKNKLVVCCISISLPWDIKLHIAYKSRRCYINPWRYHVGRYFTIPKIKLLLAPITILIFF